MFVYAINTQYHANTLKSHCANIEPLHLQLEVSPIDIALGQMAAIQKRLAQMLRVASSVAKGAGGGLELFRFWPKNFRSFSFEFPILAEKSISISVKTFFFFWRPPVFGRKNFRISELSEKFPFNFRTNHVILIQEQ